MDFEMTKAAVANYYPSKTWKEKVERMSKRQIIAIAYRMYVNKDCYACVHYKKTSCPNSSECYSTENKPYFKRKEGIK